MELNRSEVPRAQGLSARPQLRAATRHVGRASIAQGDDSSDRLTLRVREAVPKPPAGAGGRVAIERTTKCDAECPDMYRPKTLDSQREPGQNELPA